MAVRTKPASCCAPVSIRRLAGKQVQRLAEVAKALADPNRIEMLRLLAAQAGPVCACDIVDRFDLSQPTVSHHLKVLKEAGLLKSSREGLWVYYSVDREGARALESLSALVQGQ